MKTTVTIALMTAALGLMPMVLSAGEKGEGVDAAIKEKMKSVREQMKALHQEMHKGEKGDRQKGDRKDMICLLYTSDAADE